MVGVVKLKPISIMTIKINQEGREPIRATRVAKYYSIPVYFPYISDRSRHTYRKRKRFEELDPTFNIDRQRLPFFVVHLEISSKQRMAGVKEFKDSYYRDDYYCIPDAWFLDRKQLTFYGNEVYLRKEDCVVVPDIEGETGKPPKSIRKRIEEPYFWR